MTEKAAHALGATLKDAPVLLLIGSGYRPYREYILAAVSKHYRLWLLDSAEATWQMAYCAGSARVDTRNAEALRQAGISVAASLPVVGVFTYDESQVVTCAQLARDLGLPGSPPEAIIACRDKAATRAVLTAAGVPQPLSHTVTSAAEALAAAEKIGYPVIVKARALAASCGVVRVDGPEDIARAFATADSASFMGLPRYEENVLVEELLTGPEISVDAVIRHEQVTPTVVARKRLGPEPYFEETGHDVDASDPLLGDEELISQVRQIHHALGLVDGATHSEFRLTPQGPRLIEINARLGGDLIPYLGLLASGADPVVAAAHVAAGCEPDTTPRFRKAAGVRFLLPDRHCEVTEVVVHEERFGPTVIEAGITAARGARMALPPSAFMTRYAHVVAVGDSMAQVIADLAEPERLVELRCRPLAD